MPDQHSQLHRRRFGFTLVELIVVMGIIVLLMGFVLAAVLHAMKAGKKSRVQADFNTIQLALEAYHDNFQDYPRFYNNLANAGALTLQWDWNNMRGAELLCRALVGPGAAIPQVAGVTVGPPEPQPNNTGADGADGPGFRTRMGISGTQYAPQGKVWGPYLQPDKFRIFVLNSLPAPVGQSLPAGSIDASAILLDSEGHSILYFPAAQAMPNFSSATNTAYLNYYFDPKFPPSPVPQYLYNSFDNCSDTGFVGGVPPDPLNTPLNTTGLKQADFNQLLGATPGSGQLIAPQTPAYTGPYILWSAGADGNLGISTKDGKSDDVTNFEFPAQLRK